MPAWILSNYAMKCSCAAFFAFITLVCAGEPCDVKKSDSFRRIKLHIDSVPAIDTHDHLKPLSILQGSVRTDQGIGMTLYSLWSSSYHSFKLESAGCSNTEFGSTNSLSMISIIDDEWSTVNEVED